jgi:hypothetical protein
LSPYPTVQPPQRRFADDEFEALRRRLHDHDPFDVALVGRRPLQESRFVVPATLALVDVKVRSFKRRG